MTGHKTVTRRRWKPRQFKAWCWAWDHGRLRHDAWDHVPRVKGARRFGSIELTCRPYLEPLRDMPQEDLSAEGFGGGWALPGGIIGFWEMFGGDLDEPIAVIRFRFVPDP
jgi:hypothetical protein